jgi:hypothetical protein
MGKGSKEQVNRRQYETDYSYLHGINGIQPHGLCAETRKKWHGCTSLSNCLTNIAKSNL